MANVLIVDDEESERVLQRTLLEDAGHRVWFASDGERALEVYRGNPIDVVVTDLRMPRVNGLRLIREIRDKDPYAAVVAVSGASADQLDLAAELGAAATLHKPLRPDALLGSIEAALAARRSKGDGWGH